VRVGPLDILLLCIVIGAIILIAVAALVSRRAHKSAGTEPCRFCGYSMQGAATPRCPECGREFVSLNGQPYVGRSRAVVRSIGVLFLAAICSISVANTNLPT
jgi:transposase-like protein